MSEMSSMLEESYRESPHTGRKQANLCGDTDGVASLIKEARLRKRISQKDLAGQAGMTPVQLCRIEGGECRPSRQTLRKLSGYIGVPYSELLVQAGYNNLKGDDRLYKRDGNILDAEQIVESIYRIDSDFLDYFRDFEEIGTEENIEIIKMLLMGMRKEAETRRLPREHESFFSRYFQNSFLALKRFIISSLSPLAELEKNV